ncbi:YggS family pyridoxal phosphate-dependent enzyme [Chloroflexota bacterium]
MGIKQNVERLLSDLPEGVQLVAAAKTRKPHEIMEAITSGVTIIGENYVQEAEEAFETIGHQVDWHFIGRLQKNKVKKAVKIFDLIETVDSVELAGEINKSCSQIGKIMPVLIEINSGREQQKAGVFPEGAEQLAREISSFPNVKVLGLMTMGPQSGNPEDARPYFIETQFIYGMIKGLDIPGIEMRYLSMGMTNSYQIALEEGANIIRIGSKIFGERDDSNIQSGQ